MNSRRSDTVSTVDREIVITRVISAPRELVFKAWTEPKHLPLWWGPKDFTITTYHIDIRPGGEWLFTMHGPDERDYENRIVYEEIVNPERMVYRHGDEGAPGFFRTTVTFDDQGAQTVLTLRAVFASAAERDYVVREYGAIEGGKQTLERLAEEVARIAAIEAPGREFVIARTFDAPRELVFKVWTDPGHLRHWWGPKGCTVVHGKMNLKPGGTYHYGMQWPDGNMMWGKFVYREIIKPERIVLVSSFSNEHGDVVRAPFSAQWPREMFSIFEFAEQAGKTTVTVRTRALNPSAAELGTFEAGFDSMNQGWGGTFEQLADYLATL